MANKMELTGADALQKALGELPKSLSKGVLRRALTKGAEPVLQAARENVPVDQGDLRDSLAIATRLSKGQRQDSPRSKGAEIFIGPSWPKGAHGHLVEFGTSNTPAQPFLRTAWDSRGEQVLPKFGEEVWVELEKTARRLAKQAERGKLSAAARRHLTR